MMADDTSTQAMGGGARVSVLLPLPLAGAYDYVVPEGLRLQPGEFVVVPLGTREVLGVVWGPGTDGIDPAKLKPVVERLEEAPALPEAVRRFVDWVASYTLAPPGAVLRMAMSVPSALGPPKPTPAFRFVRMPEEGERMTPQRRRVLELLADGMAWTPTDLAREAGVGTGVVKSLETSGHIERVGLPPPPPFAQPEIDRPSRVLSEDQAAAAAELCRRLVEHAFSPRKSPSKRPALSGSRPMSTSW